MENEPGPGQALRRVSGAEAGEILRRASQLDDRRADELTLAELRDAALEAGMAAEAVDAALAEWADAGHVDAPGSAPRGLGPLGAGEAAYGAIGAVLGVLAVLGGGEWVDLAFLGLAVTVIQGIVRHVASGRPGALLREAAVLWTAYCVAWVLGGGDPWPHLFALPPLGMTVSGIAALVARGRSAGAEEPAALPPAVDRSALPPTPDGSALSGGGT